MGTPSKEMLLAASRVQDDDVADDLHKEGPPKRGRDPGRRSADEPEALSYPEWFGAIDRRAEPGAAVIDDEAGALATAFTFARNASGRGLPVALLARLTAELGVDLTRVRIHDDEHAARACAAIGARAFASGDDIYFAAGAYDPVSVAGVELIAHEVAHIAHRQQSSAPAAARLSRPDDHHEREADAFAQAFTRGAQSNDPASLVNRTRREGQRIELPFRAELEEQFGMPLDFVEAYTGDAARIACELMAASAFAVRSVVAFADATPQREVLMHELAHVMQMGGRSSQAPRAFAPGSLSVGGRHDAAEHDAHAVVGGAPVSVSSSPDVVRRAGDDEKTQEWSIDEAVKRFEAFAKKLDKRKKGEGPNVFGKPGTTTVRYIVTSKKPFMLAEYQAAIKAQAKYKKLSDADLEKDLKEIHNQRKDQGLVKVGTENAKRWAYIDPTETPSDPVEYLLEEVYKHASNKEKYEGYCDSLAALKKLTKKPTLALADKATCTFSKEEEAQLFTNKELEDARHAIGEAVINEGKTGNYKIKNDEWKIYFSDVVDSPKKFAQALVGEWFGEIAAHNLSEKGGTATKVKSVQYIFEHDDLPNDENHRADGFVIEGKQIKIAEFKTGPGNPGSADNEEGKLMSQAKGYALIVEKGIHAIDVPGTKRTGPFTQCVYIFTTKKMAETWGPKLKTVFDKVGAKAGAGLVVYPPAGQGIATLTFNPTFEVPLADAKTNKHHITNPAVIHPGVNFKSIDVTMKEPGSSEVTGGEVVFDLDMKDGVTAKNVKKTIKPGPAGGSVENEKFPGLKSTLDKVFKGRVEADAKLTDTGVEATLTVKEGPSGIPNLLLKGSTVKVGYTSGNLTVEGEIELSNAKGNLHGKAKVTWDGNEFGFAGEATLEPGMIDGLGRTTGTVEYKNGNWKFGIAEASYTRKLGAVTLTGKAFGLEFDTKTGGFSGLLELDADMGMFGKAACTAQLKDNKLTKADFSYDSPELKYPKDKPVIVGTVGGTVTYNNGKFSGNIRGTADLKIQALQKLAKDGIGLAVDAHIGEDGSYSGTIKSTKAIELGKHLRIPSVGLTLEKDGSLKGDFELEIVNIKNLKTAKAKGTVDATGVHIESAEATVTFGDPSKKFWGEVTAKYTDEKGFDVSGTANYKIKDDIIATGTIKYSQETNAIGVELKVSEITLFDKSIHKDLFSASKQIPVVNIYGLGIYIDIGFDLGFDFGFKLTMAPSAKVEDFSLETLEFKRISAKLEVGGDIYAQLTGTPKLGIGVFALDPSIIRGGGGLKVPIVGRLDVKPKATFEVGYAPDGGADASAKLGISGEFGIKGSVKPYAEFALLNNLWNPKWEGEALAEFEILKPTELFNFTVDLNSKEKQEDPALPGKNETKAPSEPEGDQKAKAAPKEATERGAGAAKTDAKQGEVAEGGDEGPFSLNALMEKLKAIPGFTTAKKIFEYGQKIWKVVKPIWDLVSPLMDIIVKRIEEVIGLFDPGPSEDGLGAWLWKLAKFLFNVSFGGIIELASAIKTLLGQAVDFAKKLINKAVQDGHIGVKRHSYYIWTPWPFDDIEFMAAAEWKINIPGIADLGQGGPPSVLVTPSGAISLVLYEALGLAGVGITYVGRSDIGEPYNDRWTGAGARG